MMNESGGALELDVDGRSCGASGVERRRGSVRYKYAGRRGMARLTRRIVQGRRLRVKDPTLQGRRIHLLRSV